MHFVFQNYSDSDGLMIHDCTYFHFSTVSITRYGHIDADISWSGLICVVLEVAMGYEPVPDSQRFPEPKQFTLLFGWVHAHFFGYKLYTLYAAIILILLVIR